MKNIEIDKEVSDIMRERGGNWYAYRNVDLGHPEVGRLQFLQCGEGCTYEEPPKQMPDNHLGIGWRYTLVSENPVEL